MRRVKLGELFSVKHGYAFPGADIVNKADNPEYCLVTPGNFDVGGGFKDNRNKSYIGDVDANYVLTPGDIVVTMTDLSKAGDTLGYTAKIPHSDTVWLHNQRVGKLVFHDENSVSVDYIKYRLWQRDYRAWILGSATGSTVRHTSPSRIEMFEIDLPPLDEQKRIAHILGSFDDKIELNRKMNETLEAMAQALFKDWFVDFGPTRAKMEGKEPYLAPELWELFPDKLGEDGVPEGWGMRRLDEFFPVITGKKNANFGDSAGVYPFFTCAVDQTLFANSYSFDADAILLAGNGNFNVKWYRGKFEAYQRTYVLIPYKPQLLSILHALMQYFLNDLVVGHKGSVINYLTKGMITDYSKPLPTDHVLCTLASRFDVLYHFYEKNLREIRALETMRDTMLTAMIL